jgi:hypothetical protein
MVYFQSFLVQYKRIFFFKSKANETEQLLIDMEIKNYNNSANYPD